MLRIGTNVFHIISGFLFTIEKNSEYLRVLILTASQQSDQEGLLERIKGQKPLRYPSTTKCISSSKHLRNRQHM